MPLITYANKDKTLPTSDVRRLVRDVDLNEIKDVVNANQTALPGTIQAAIDALIAGSPGALDTLNELAAALGDDANFAASMTTALGLKLTITNIKENIVPSGTVNGSNTAFTFPDTPIGLKLYVDGIRVKGGGVDYTQSGANITMNVAPSTAIIGDYRV